MGFGGGELYRGEKTSKLRPSSLRPVDMKRMLSGVAGCVVAAALCAHAQTHKVAKTQDVVRAVGVYEWTGDLAKPTASRLIPVTVFIDGKLEDGGVYLARPVPFALQSGNLYELDLAGLNKGSLELAYARHLRAVETATGDSLFDDGWFGYGNFRAPAASRKIVPLKPSAQVSQITSSKDDSKPHFAGKQPASDSTSGAKDTTASSSSSKDTTTTASNSGSGSTPAGDPDRPTMRRRDGGSSSSSGTASTTTADTSSPAADDPDRPHLTRKTSTDDSVPPDPNDKSSGSGGNGSGSSSAGSSRPAVAEGGSADDPDRPTLKRRSPQDAKGGQKKGDTASVSGVGLLNDDPDRPNLHRGKPTSAMNEDDLPKLKGLPADLHQMVAVSDAVNRDPHDFARPWEDDAERAAVLTKMQALARAKLAAYGAAAEAAGAAAAKGAPAPPAPKPGTPAAAAAARRAAAAKKTAPPLSPVALADEELKGFTLSYGGAPTYVYSAHTEGTASGIVFVTIVAQTDSMGEFKPAIQSVTDAAHLDRTPRMRLVDAVDVEASNRASLLFELRGAQSRQFGVYRVIGAQASETFVTGSTQ
jgi:hypothetical protein